MHILYRGPRWVYEAARWLSEKEGGDYVSPVVLHDRNTPLSGTEIYLSGAYVAPRKLCLLKLNGRELSVPGLSVPQYAKNALCFIMVRVDFRLDHNQEDISDLHNRLVGGHLRSPMPVEVPLGQIPRPYA